VTKFSCKNLHALLKYQHKSQGAGYFLMFTLYILPACMNKNFVVFVPSTQVFVYCYLLTTGGNMKCCFDGAVIWENINEHLMAFRCSVVQTDVLPSGQSVTFCWLLCLVFDCRLMLAIKTVVSEYYVFTVPFKLF